MLIILTNLQIYWQFKRLMFTCLKTTTDGKIPKIIFMTAVAVSIVSLSISLLLSAINFCAFDKTFYRQNFHNLHTAAKVGISEADLEAGIDVLFAYLRDKRDDIQLEVEVLQNLPGESPALIGRKVPMYDARESAHMVDVKALYQNALFVKKINLFLAICFVGLSLLSLFYLQKSAAPLSRRFVLLYFASCSSVFIAVLAVLAVYIYLNFNDFWLRFHELFFTNDLWQLDPAVSRMINLVEGQFFDNLVNYILQTVAWGMALTYLIYLSLLLQPAFYAHQTKRLLHSNKV